MKPTLGNENPIAKAREAISELFLDVELQDHNYASIARRLRETGIPFGELDRIYAEEVAPVAHINLKVTAGVWDGFDPIWLNDKIERKKRKIHFFKRYQFVWRIYKHWVTRSTISEWNRVRKVLEVPEAGK